MADTSGIDRDTLAPEVDPELTSEAQTPPRTFLGTLRQLGPGLIIAGSIVGSGELIATTKTGAEAGISLLWLVIIGCLIKVFVQIELGRHAITHGETTLSALNSVPGPRGLRANWIVWFWLAMMLTGLAQLGGIVGGVGQAMAISFPITHDYASAIRTPSGSELEQYLEWDDVILSEFDFAFGAPAELWGTPEKPDDDSFGARLVDFEMALSIRAWDTIKEVERDNPQVINEARQSAKSLVELSRGLNSQDERTTLRQIDEERTALYDALHDVNLARLDKALQERDESLSDEQKERLLRGHSVIASQLVELNEGRSFECLMAVQEAKQAKAREHAERTRLEDARQHAPSLYRGKDAPDVANAVRNLRFADIDAQAADAKVSAIIDPWTWDDRFWAACVALVTIALLYNGRYGIIQSISTALVVGFTFITLGNVIQLERAPEFRVSASEILRGLSFGLPESAGGLKTALATFGIIGVGATELITYPYWCIEKGYAKFTGRRSDSEQWATRARGWMRVMLYDTFLSMVVYTVATLAFFLMGVAVLHNEGRDPDGMRMVSTLATAYVPVFGEYAKWLFLIGAFAVLYSTFLVANAGNARLFTDGLKIWGLMNPHDQRKHNRAISTFGVLLPLICLALFWSGINPVTAILVAGMMQATMLPMIGIGALYFRWTATDPRLAPSRAWDVVLVISCIGLLIAGGWGVISRFI
jgi:Mn2+/Fe2+ NRAMP family transporter